MYVKRRDWHYLCGVTTAIEYLAPVNGEDGFALQMIDRKRFVMYPEDKLGGVISSASSQWKNVEQLFQGIRDIISSGTEYTSGTFSIAWTNGCQKFLGGGVCAFRVLCDVCVCVVRKMCCVWCMFPAPGDCDAGFALRMIDRKAFTMYSEEKLLGGLIISVSSQCMGKCGTVVQRTRGA